MSKYCKNPECRKLNYNSLQPFCSYECRDKIRPPEPVKKKAIPKVSAKRKLQNIIYSSERIKFLMLAENMLCPITGEMTTEVHHTYSGKDRAKYYLDKSTWLAVSRDGHNWIHDNPAEAREKGYLK